MTTTDNDRCQAIYEACKALNEHEALAALAGLVDKQGPTTILAMLATVLAVKEAAQAPKEPAKEATGNVIAFPGNSTLN